MVIDVVVPIHDAWPYAEKCLTTLLDTSSPWIRNLVIVDDASSLETKAALMTWITEQGSQARVVLLKTKKQQWFTRAANIGLRATIAPYVALINSDCELREGWLTEMFRVMQASESVLVGAFFEPQNVNAWKCAVAPEYVTGHCWLVDRRAFDLVGFLDEQRNDAIHINSDRYFCYALERVGQRVAYAYHANVIHHGSKSWDPRQLGRVLQLTKEDLT